MPEANRRTIVISANASWNLINFRRALISELVSDGHRVVILAPEDEHSGHFAELGAEFVPIGIDSQGVSPLNDLILLGCYRSALRNIGADLFLGYTIKPNIYGSLAAASLGIPIINNISGLGTAFIKPGLLTRVVTRLYRSALRRSATVFFQNADDLKVFVEKKIVRSTQTRLLPGSGIDLKRFTPQPKAEDGIFRFLLLGRLLWDKGVAEYVEAARLVHGRYPATVFRLLGFVDVPNRTAVSKADIDRWIAEGLIDYFPACDDVRAHIAAADCVVLPSYREGLPRALLEGAAMAKPLIATDAPGCRDVVEDGINGFLCTVRDAQSLADTMCRMVALDPVHRQAMGHQSRRLVEERFDQASVVQSYRQAIQDALAHPA